MVQLMHTRMANLKIANRRRRRMAYSSKRHNPQIQWPHHKEISIYIINAKTRQFERRDTTKNYVRGTLKRIGSHVFRSRAHLQRKIGAAQTREKPIRDGCRRSPPSRSCVVLRHTDHDRAGANERKENFKLNGTQSSQTKRHNQFYYQKTLSHTTIFS